MTTVLLLAGAALVQGAPSFFGPTGNILTPDAITAPMHGFDVGYHGFFNMGDAESDLNVFHGNIGLTPNIEVGAAWFDPDTGDGDLAINGKWRFLDETATRPALAVGVFDAASELDDDAAFYVLASKNLTEFAQNVVEGESKPLRGTIGVASGIYDGFFAALDWTLASKLSVMLEFASFDPDGSNDSTVNAGVRWAAGPGLRLDAALIDFDDLAAGISLTKSF